MRLIDLRSDTVTRPTPGMREAMARAEVGDDVYGEDPTVNQLEARIAELTGKEAAVFVPTGTMGNQIALQCHTRHGDEVLIGEGSHILFDETGAGAAFAGVQFQVVGRGGLFTAAELTALLREPDDHCATQRLVTLENPHNRAGGRPFAQEEVRAIADLARSRGLALHLDGARIWNAAIATGLSPAELAAPFDTVNLCFSKGLGAPVGSALCGSAKTITAARRFRKMFGGGMRQAGVLAAAALYALDHHRERVANDHEAALSLAEALRDAVKATAKHRSGEPSSGSSPRAEIVYAGTNQVNIDTDGLPAERLIEAAKRRKVLVGAMGPFRTRAVTHLDVAPEDVKVAGQALAEAIDEVLAARDR